MPVMPVVPVMTPMVAMMPVVTEMVAMAAVVMETSPVMVSVASEAAPMRVAAGLGRRPGRLGPTPFARIAPLDGQGWDFGGV